MNTVDELLRRELLALKEIRLTGQTTDCTIMLQLLADNMIASFKDGCLQLTDKGRRMLVRGSPSLWDMGS